MDGMMLAKEATDSRRGVMTRVQEIMALSAAEPGLVLAAIAEARQLNAADLIKAVLEMERNRLCFKARDAAAPVWSEDARRRIAEDWTEMARYTVRIHPRMFSVTIEWGRKIFFQKDGRRRMFFKWLRRGGSYSMDLSLFEGAERWELDQIKQAELEFGKLRAHAAYLRRVGRNLRFDPDAKTPGTLKPMFFDLEDMTLR